MIFFMAHFFFFFDPYNLPYSYLQNLNVVRIKLGAFLEEIFTFLSLQGSSYMKVMNSFLLAEMHYN
jgi:hypothetical protein